MGKTFDIISYKQASHFHDSGGIRGYYCQDIEKRQPAGSNFGSLVQYLPDRIVCGAENIFNAVDGTNEMAFINCFASTTSDKDVLVVVGHPAHLMRYYLPDGNEQVMFPR